MTDEPAPGRYRLREAVFFRDQVFPAGTIFTTDRTSLEIGRPIDPAFPEVKVWPLTPDVPLQFCDFV